MVRLGALIIAHVPAVRPGLRNWTMVSDTCGIPLVPRFSDGPCRLKSNLVVGASGSAVNADDELSVEPGSS